MSVRPFFDDADDEDEDPSNVLYFFFKVTSWGKKPLEARGEAARNYIKY